MEGRASGDGADGGWSELQCSFCLPETHKDPRTARAEDLLVPEPVDVEVPGDWFSTTSMEVAIDGSLRCIPSCLEVQANCVKPPSSGSELDLQFAALKGG